jgi:hypothetical protein
MSLKGEGEVGGQNLRLQVNFKKTLVSTMESPPSKVEGVKFRKLWLWTESLHWAQHIKVW